MKLNIITSVKGGRWGCRAVQGGRRDCCQCQQGFVTIRGARGGWELWDRDFNLAFHLCREVASVVPICSTSLLIFPRTVPGWEPGKGDILMEAAWVLLWSPQAGAGASADTCDRGRCNRAVTSVADTPRGSFPDRASIIGLVRCLTSSETVVKIEFRKSVTQREDPFGGASWFEVALQLLLKSPFFIKPSKQEHVKMLATERSCEGGHEGAATAHCHKDL